MKIIPMLLCLAVLLSVSAGLLADPYVGRIGVGDTMYADAVRRLPQTAIHCSPALWRPITSFRLVEVRVVKDTTFFARTLRVAPLGRKDGTPDVFEVDVPRNADVIKHGRRISVHDVRTGDVIRAEGQWSGKKFVACGLIVNEGDSWLIHDRDRDYRTIEGRIRNIDYLGRNFTLDSSNGSRTVYADRARVWRDGGIVNFDELLRGQTIWVRGNLDGHRIDAERIEISRANHHRDLYMM